MMKATPGLFLSVSLSLCPSAWDNWASTGQILMKFDVWLFFSKICWENSGLINIAQE